MEFGRAARRGLGGEAGLTTLRLELCRGSNAGLWQHWSAACSGPMSTQPVRQRAGSRRGPIKVSTLC